MQLVDPSAGGCREEAAVKAGDGQPFAAGEIKIDGIVGRKIEGARGYEGLPERKNVRVCFQSVHHELFQISHGADSVLGTKDAPTLGDDKSICDFQMPKCGHVGARATEKGFPNVRCIGRYRGINKPCECH